MVSVGAGKPLPVILYFHGGGYCIGSAQTHRDLVSRICIAAGARALSVDYRLAPSIPFLRLSTTESPPIDGSAAGAPATSIVIAGDSAGGGLALATLLGRSSRQETNFLPAAYACRPSPTSRKKADRCARRSTSIQWCSPRAAPHMREIYRRRGHQNAARLAAVRRAEGTAAVAYSGGHVEVLMDDSTRFAKSAGRRRGG